MRCCFASRTRGFSIDAERNDGTTVVSSDKVNEVAAIQSPAMSAGRVQNLSVSTEHPFPFRSDLAIWAGPGEGDRYVAPGAGNAKDAPSAT